MRSVQLCQNSHHAARLSHVRQRQQGRPRSAQRRRGGASCGQDYRHARGQEAHPDPAACQLTHRSEARPLLDSELARSLSEWRPRGARPWAQAARWRRHQPGRRRRTARHALCGGRGQIERGKMVFGPRDCCEREGARHAKDAHALRSTERQQGSGAAAAGAPGEPTAGQRSRQERRHTGSAASLLARYRVSPVSCALYSHTRSRTHIAIDSCTKLAGSRSSR